MVGGAAVLEMAQAAGLQLLAPAERNPLLTSTFGLGEMVADALRQGVERIVMGIGGSATHDLGLLLYTSDAAAESRGVSPGGRRVTQKLDH